MAKQQASSSANKARSTRARRSPRPTRRAQLDPGALTEPARRLECMLQRRIVGQDHVIRALGRSFARAFSALRDPDRPVASLLLLGPTGVGKTETAKAIARTLFGQDRALTRVNCEEYSHGHEIAKLLGAPPGYVGYDTTPLLNQKRLERGHRQAIAEGQGLIGTDSGALTKLYPVGPGTCLSIVLFDEIEKAHPTLWNAMLGILEDGILTLGDNTEVDFTRSIIIMTSNVGNQAMTEILERRPMGFGREAEGAKTSVGDVESAARDAARKIFPLEFINRFDELLVYSALEREHLTQIFDKHVADLHERARLQAGLPLNIKVSDEARELIVERGVDPTLGARPLRRAIDSELIAPLSRLVATRQLAPGDQVEVERDGEQLTFYRQRPARTMFVA